MENIQEEIEGKIIDWIALGTNGRLVAFEPEKGADLAVQKKGGYQGEEVLFNVESFILPAGKESFVKKISSARITSQKNLYLIFVIFDEISQKVDDKIWLVPAVDFETGKDVVFEEPKFEKYISNKSQFVDFLIEKLITKNKSKAKKGFEVKKY